MKDPDLSFRDIPSKWSIRDSIYITPGLKRDYGKMKNEGLTGNEISLVADETNMGLNNYKIEFPIKEKEIQKVIKPLKNN
jgi:hypothetical protein